MLKVLNALCGCQISCYTEKSDILSIAVWEILPTPLSESRQQSVGIVALWELHCAEMEPTLTLASAHMLACGKSVPH